MKHHFTYLCAVATCVLAAFSGNEAEAVKVHTIGDSTMATYADGSGDKRGWGQMFNQFFTEEVTVNNRAKSGASSKSFYKDAPYWATVLTQIEAGDYVLIQFAHNDEKCDGVDGDEWNAEHPDEPYSDVRGTAPFGTYKEYLRKYIDETRALDATPVLVTPIVRKYFENGKISQKGRHNLSTDGSHDLDYVLAMKEVAAEKEVQLIDHTEMTANFVEAYGDALATELLYCEGDKTHTSATGAVLFARLVAQDMVRQGILAEYIDAEASLIVNPAAVDFGRGYPGTAKTYECIVLGMDLVPADGNMTLTTEAPFSVSVDGGATYNTTGTIAYTDGNLNLVTFYVRCQIDVAGTLTGTLTVGNGNIEKNISLTMEVVDLADGEPFHVFWELNKDDSYECQGPVTPVDESWSKMYIEKYSAPNTNTTWPEDSGFDTTYKTQRNLIEGGTWPGLEIDAVSDRYIQFGVTANAGTKMTIDTIGVYIGGAGGSGMRWRVEYSTEENFGNEVVLSEILSITKNTMYRNEAQPMVQVEDGKTLYVRVYPWYDFKSSVSGKTICLSNLYIGGLVSKSTAVDAVEQDNTLRYEGTTVRSASNEVVYIYNVSGACVARGTANVSLAALPNGIYLAKCGDTVLRVVR